MIPGEEDSPWHQRKYLHHLLLMLLMMTCCRMIPAGSVVLVETAVASVNVSDQSHRYCDHCHHQLNLTLVPCNHCSEVAYCSQHCRSEARQSYHKYECGNTHTFRRILENVKREGGKNKMGSTFDFSRLCFRVSFYKLMDKKQILLSQSIIILKLF